MVRVFPTLVCAQLQDLLLWLIAALECHGDADGVHTQLVTVTASDVEGDAADARRWRNRRVSVAPPTVRPTPAFAFLLALTARHVADNAAPRAQALLDRAWPRAGGDDAGVDVGDTRKRATDVASSLLKRYAIAHGERLVALVRQAIDTADWLKMKEPRDSRLYVGMVLEEVAALRVRVAAALGEDTSPVAPPRRPSTLGRMLTSERGLHLDIERIFTAKNHVYGAVEFTSDSVVTGVLKVVFKALCECTRLCTFAKNGYQQVQVDIAVFQLALGYLVRSPRQLAEMLDEALASAAERALDPTPLEASIVLSIASDRLERLGLIPAVARAAPGGGSVPE